MSVLRTVMKLVTLFGLLITGACSADAGSVQDFDPTEVQRGSNADEEYVHRGVEAATKNSVAAALLNEGHDLEVNWIMLLAPDENEREGERASYALQLEFGIEPPASSMQAMHERCPALPDGKVVNSMLLQGTVSEEEDAAWVFVLYGDGWRVSCGPDSELLPSEEEEEIRELKDPEDLSARPPWWSSSARLVHVFVGVLRFR